MNARATLLPFFLLTSCSASLPPPPARSIYIAEHPQHVVAFVSATVPASSVPEWYAKAMETWVPALREARGNLGVYVLRNDRDDGQVLMTVLSEWNTREDLERCRSAGTCSMLDDDEEILFEALR